MKRTVIALSCCIALGAGALFGCKLLLGGGAETLASALCWVTWGAVVTGFAILSKDESELLATSRLMTLRGLSLRSQIMGREAAQLALTFAAFALPSAVLCLGLGVRAASLTEAAQCALVLLGLLATGAAASLFLSGLSLVSRQLSAHHPGSVLLALVVIPDLLHEALPELPSLLATSSWLFTLAIAPVVG